MPTPTMKRRFGEGTVMVNGLAPALKAISLIVMLFESETPVLFETAKVATSDSPLGTVAGVQLAAVFQSPVTGLRFQVALPANAFCTISKDEMVMLRTNTRNVFNFIYPIDEKKP